MKTCELSDRTLGRFAGIRHLRNAGIVLGLGIGGFFDRIMLHQILGWHYVVYGPLTSEPSSIPELEHQNRLDGFFDLACWILILVGLALLSRAIRDGVPARCGKALAGAILIGCGLYNFVEAIVGHQIIGLHRTFPHYPHQLLYDSIFLGSGILLALIGWLMGRSVDPTVAI